MSSLVLQEIWSSKRKFDYESPKNGCFLSFLFFCIKNENFNSHFFSIEDHFKKIFNKKMMMWIYSKLTTCNITLISIAKSCK